MPLRNTPIRRKLMTVNLLTSGTVLLLTCAGFITYEIVTLHRNMLQSYATRAQIIAANSTASLAFQNQADADDVLGALKTDRRIMAACIYDSTGKIFATFPTNASTALFPAASGQSGYRAGHLEIFCPVIQGDRTLGTVYLQSDLSTLTDRYRAYAWLAAIIIASSALVAYLLSRTLQKQISLPILALAETAQTISNHRDFSVRAVKTGGDETGLLTDAFNQLLTSIEERDKALSAANASLRGEITERKQAEEAMRRSESRYRTLFDTLIEGFCTVEVIFDAGGKPVDYRFLEVNPAFERQTGLQNAEGKLMRDLVPDHEARWFEIYGKIALTGEAAHFENEAKSLGRYYDVYAYRVGEPESRKVAILFSDITERKVAEEKVHAQLARLELLHRITHATGERQDLQSIFQVVIRTLEEHLPVDFCCICLYEQNTNSLLVTGVGVHSEALAMELAMTKQARVEVDQNGLSQCVNGRLVYEPDISESKFPFPQRLARGGLRSLVISPLLVESQVFGILVSARRQPHGFSSGECEFLRQLSEHVALAAHQAQLYEALQQAYNDLRQTQQAIMQQERLKALGQMASGIAHDINNAISPVALYTESLLEKEPGLSPRARDYLTTIQHAIEDVSHTVARMREFYRQRETQLTLVPVKLNPLIQQVIDLSRARWSDMPQQRGIFIKIETDFAPELPIVSGVESEIREALVNLVFNAVDAMPEGGTLTLRTKISANVVHVEVSDTGVGMDEDTRRRCLEPFFTTKGERGTGLGLAMVYGIVRRHNADIEIESAPGKGTTMRLSFQVPATQLAEPGKPAAAFIVPTRLRILVVDDDPLLIKSLRDTLETDGHVVVTANAGQDGISIFRKAHENSEPFAIVITDLGMPYIDGRQVAAAVKKISPTTPVIMLTGWGQRLIAEGDIPPFVDRVLNKPPKLRDLREALAQCLQPAKS